MKKIPQPTQNWFKTPNYIYDILPELTGNEVKIIIAMCRKENYTDPNFKWSISYLSKISGMSKQTAIDAKKSLIEKELIFEDGIAEDGSKFLFINWEKEGSQEIRHLSNNLIPPVKNLDTPYQKIGLPPVKNLDTVLDQQNGINNQKENTRKNMPPSINKLYDDIQLTLKKEFGNKMRMNPNEVSEIHSIIREFETPIPDLVEKINQLKQLYETKWYKENNQHPTPKKLIEKWNELHNIKVETKEEVWETKIFVPTEKQKETIEERNKRLCQEIDNKRDRMISEMRAA